MGKLLTIIFIGALLLSSTILYTNTKAIPAFARKYETSCVTCHIGFPKLNSFGEAYRLNGYQYPEDDADQTKDEPVSLGSESYKRVFPKAVWPNDISGKPPIALRVESGFEYDRTEEIKTSFIAPSLTLFSAGTMGENIGFYAGAHLFEEGEIGSLGRAFIQLSNFLEPKLGKNTLNIRLGQFIPNIVSFSNHRGLAVTPYAYNTYSATSEGFSGGHAHGSTSFGLEALQVGLELSGIIKSKFRWGAGLVNGAGSATETNSAKDGYFKADYKFGGMGYDGSESNPDQSGRNWVEKSIAIGGFSYFGSTKNNDLAGPNDLKIARYGININLYWNNSNLFGGWINGNDEAMDLSVLEEKKYDLAFTELNQVVYPWLIGLIRYERAEPENALAIERTVLGFTALYRANMKFVFETAFDPSDVNFGIMVIKLDFAI